MRYRPMIGHREVAALEELVSNGSVQALSRLLSSLDDAHPLLVESVWKKAWEESKRESLDGIGSEDLLLPKFSGVQSLLLQLSTDALEV